MAKFNIVFFKSVKKNDRRFAAQLEITAYNRDCAETMASSLLDNLPQSWFYEVHEVQDGN